MELFLDKWLTLINFLLDVSNECNFCYCLIRIYCCNAARVTWFLFGLCLNFCTSKFNYLFDHFQIIRQFSYFSLINLDFSLKCKDSAGLMHRLFIDKIHKLLKQHDVPGKYACGFAFAASDSIENMMRVWVFLLCMYYEFNIHLYISLFVVCC